MNNTNYRNYKKTVYHGSPTLFKKFSHKTKGTRTKHESKDVGFHFTDSIQEAETYSKLHSLINAHLYKLAFGGEYPKSFTMIEPTIYQVKLDMKNPLVYLNSKIATTNEVIRKAIRAGHDSLVYEIRTPTYNKTEFVVFKVSQIKIIKVVPIFDPKKVEKLFKELKK
jgi:hypothetical protein